MQVFGVTIDGGKMSEIVSRMGSQNSCFWIATVNPEILLEAKENERYRVSLQSANYKTIDGFGLFLFVRYVLRRTCSRVTGVELSARLMRYANNKAWRVGFIGASIPHRGTASRAAGRVKEQFPNLLIHAEDGGNIDQLGVDDYEGDEARHRLMLFDPEVLLVAFGHPKQELWIQRYKQDFPSLKVIVGVGGTFDFWAGNVKRAPECMRQIGLEWFWRLIQEPRRVIRIFRAVVIFPFLAFLEFVTTR